MRVLLVGVIVLVGCGPARPRVGSRTILIDIPMGGVENDRQRPPEECQPCLREQHDGEKLVGCAIKNENAGAHWDTMMCSFEGQ